MNDADDDRLVSNLRAAVQMLEPPTAEPDVADVRRGGRRIRTRRRVVTGLACLMLIAAGSAAAVGAMSWHPGARHVVAPATSFDRTTTAENINATLRAAMLKAGVSIPEDVKAAPTFVNNQVAGWGLLWDEAPAFPNLLALRVYTTSPTTADPCHLPSVETRNCQDEMVKGVRVRSAEVHEGWAVTGTDPQKFNMWVPRAVAIYPNGRTVEATVDLREFSSDPASQVTEREYAGPATLARLRSLVVEPSLGDMSLNARVGSTNLVTGTRSP